MIGKIDKIKEEPPKGLIYFPRNAEKVFKTAVEDLKNFPNRGKILNDLKKAREKYVELPMCYIKHGQKTYLVEEKEITNFIGKLSDGDAVYFKPAKGGLWACNIKPAKPIP